MKRNEHQVQAVFLSGLPLRIRRCMCFLKDGTGCLRFHLLLSQYGSKCLMLQFRLISHDLELNQFQIPEVGYPLMEQDIALLWPRSHPVLFQHSTHLFADSCHQLSLYRLPNCNVFQLTLSSEYVFLFFLLATSYIHRQDKYLDDN